MSATNRILTVAMLAVLSTGAVAAHEPPAELHMVGDHWTAWNPPTSFPEGAEVYTVQRGDTLWDLAESFYGDPYLWPQLWEKNPYVLDAHWIYPGDPLVTSLEVASFEQLADATADEAEAEERSPFASQSASPSALGIESDLYCHGYIGEMNEEFGYRITGSEYENLSPQLVGAGLSARPYGTHQTTKVDLWTGDIVYLDGGLGGGLTPGEVFLVVRPEEKVKHPLSGSPFGRFNRYLGTVRVLSVQEETAIAEIVRSCHPVTVGAPLKPLVPEPVPLGRRTLMRPVNAPVAHDQLADAASILFMDSRLVSLAQDHVVFIDRGAVDDVAAGDVYTIYRPNSGGQPPVVLGELAVLSVGERASLARILESRYTIFVGDRLVAK